MNPTKPRFFGRGLLFDDPGLSPENSFAACVLEDRESARAVGCDLFSDKEF